MNNQTIIILLALGAAVWWLDRRWQAQQASSGNVNDLLYQVPGNGWISHGPVLV